MIEALGSAQQMARGAGVHQQILVGGGPERTAHGGQPGNELRHGEFELADQDTAGGGHDETGAVLPGGQCQGEVGYQQRLSDFGLPANEQYALRRQQSGFGGMVSFDLDLDALDADTFFSRLCLFSLAESLGGVESLIEHCRSV